MNTVSKSIKRLRHQNNMTQDQLAEKMYVTRQTISNWETEKVQPDINTLTTLAEVFNTDIYDLIYGWPNGGYKKYQSKYVATACASMSGVFIIYFIFNYLVDVLPRAYFRWQYIVDLLIPFCSFTFMSFLGGVIIVSIISLWFDIHIQKRKYISLAFVASIAIDLIFILEIMIALVRRNFSGLLIYNLIYNSSHNTLWLEVLLIIIFPGISGICLFLYFNKLNVKNNS